MFNYEYGSINLMLVQFLNMSPVEWLRSPTEAFIACIITNVWLGVPFMMVVALGALQSIPHELYEAADLDGASWLHKVKNITIPLIRPVMIPAITLGVVWTFNNLNIVWLVTNTGEPSDQTHILVSFVYKAAFNLSKLYEQVGDREGQIEALKASLKSNPRFPEGYFFLAKAYLDEGKNLQEAAANAKKGLEVGPKSQHAALGHYVLADVYSRQGRPDEAAREAALGRALEAGRPRSP
jgi:tetratricopeptide (TPR) repeat protein